MHIRQNVNTSRTRAITFSFTGKKAGGVAVYDINTALLRCSFYIIQTRKENTHRSQTFARIQDIFAAVFSETNVRVSLST